MALIEKLKEGIKSRESIHQTTEAVYYIITDGEKRYLQIDTVGSTDREIPGKVSQSIQLSPEALLQLRKILDQNFK